MDFKQFLFRTNPLKPGQHLVQRYWVIAQPHAAGVVDRVGHRRTGATNAQLADVLDIQRIRLVIDLGQKMNFDGWNVDVRRNVVCGQIVVDEFAEALVHHRVAPAVYQHGAGTALAVVAAFF